MSKPSWLEGDWDLLRQRRLERGLPAQSMRLTPASVLLLRGGVLGVSALAVILPFSFAIGVLQAQMEQKLGGLRVISAQVKSLESQIQLRRKKLSELQRSNEGIARGLVAVSSGSALLAQLAEITPPGVQFTDLRVEGPSLSLNGLAEDPQAFRQVNGLSLMMAVSPLFESASVQVVKLQREQQSSLDSKKAELGLPFTDVAWELRARVAPLPAARQMVVLRQLGAYGMLRRLQVLERAGVLP